ncbi:hypothetical protein [Leptospira kmetyi]|uniref:hypothetical protein n=1 Tax=Leptospira kmetyi TaxID=408139 RepID=UPI001FAF9EC5|nr:hypothetical protein [Leptospira kmetyi]
MKTFDFLKRQREEIGKFIAEAYISDEDKTISYSPSKKYKIEITTYNDKRHLSDGLAHSHTYMNGKIFREGREIYNINGTTCYFYEWLEIDDSNCYLHCSEYYQGYGILNLNTLEYKFHLPEEALDGIGFIWAKGYLSPDKCKLAVEGCIWGAPYQIKVFDIKNPMDIPYALLKETNWDEEYESIKGWANANEFVYISNSEIKSISI